MLTFLNKYLLNLTFRQDTISNVIDLFRKSINGDFSRFITRVNGGQFCEYDYLSETELSDVVSYISSLGTADEITEQLKVKEIMLDITERCEQAKRVKEKYVGLYVKISLLLGVLLVILLL